MNAARKTAMGIVLLAGALATNGALEATLTPSGNFSLCPTRMALASEIRLAFISPLAGTL